ncbi:MAG: T9SS type A sorting domain-containing protein [Chitinophagales bacterium]
MKKVFTFLTAAAFSASLLAQAPVPNGSFETWTGVAPGQWSSIDQIFSQVGSNPGLVTKNTVAANVAAGSNSMKLKTDSVTITLIGQTFLVPGVAVCQKLGFDLATQSPSINGIPYTSRPDSISFQYKYASGAGGADTGGLYVRLSKWDALAGASIDVGSVFVTVTDAASFNTVKAKIQYTSAMAPDTLLIVAASSAPADGLAGLAGGGGGLGALASGLGVKGTTMYLDDLQFHGLDTVFKAYITPNSDQEICVGDTTGILTDNIAGNTIQWYQGANAIPGATFYALPITTGGDYYVKVVHNGNTYYSDTVTVNVNPKPNVAYSGLQDSICRNASAISLSGGSPAGGTYSGPGVVGGMFNPNVAGNGTKTITYTYTDQTTGCSNEASKNIVVHACSNGIDALQNDLQISMYPNPATTAVIIEGNAKLNDATVVVYDLNGAVVSTKKITAAKTSVEVQHLPVGSYLVRVVDAKNTPLAKGAFSVVR